MKKTLLALALAGAASTAYAQTITTPGVGGGTITPPSVGSGSVTTPPIAPPKVGTPGVRGPAAGGVNAPSVGSGSVNPPAVGSGGVTTPGVNPGTVTTPGVAPQTVTAPPAPNAAGSAQAKARIEADGYANVQGLTRGPDGTWRGTATRGSAQVQVSVDARGQVSTR